METLKQRTRVLVVEDEIVVSEDLQQRLTALGSIEVVGAADTAIDAIRLAKLATPDVVLMDIMLRGRADGIDAAEFLNSQLDIPVIFLTAHSDPATLQRAQQTNPMGYIVKPFEDMQLKTAIEMAQSRHEIRQKSRWIARWLASRLFDIVDPVIVIDPQSEILIFNPGAEKLTGQLKREAIGRQFSEVFALVDEEASVPLEIESANHSHCILVAEPGSKRLVTVHAMPIIDERNVKLGTIIVIIDRKQTGSDEQLQTVKQQISHLLARIEKTETSEANLGLEDPS